MLLHLTTPELARVWGPHPLLVDDGALENNHLIRNARIKATRGIDDFCEPGTLMCVIKILGILSWLVGIL